MILNKKIKLFALTLVFSLLFLHLAMSTGKAGIDIWTTTGPYGIRIGALAVDPNNAQHVFAATADGSVTVFRSLDGGQTWQPSSDWLGTNDKRAMEFAFSPDGTLYLASHCGLYASTDDGASWVQTGYMDDNGDLLPIRASTVDISPVSGDIFAGAMTGMECGFDPAANGGIYKSSDNGITWERLSNGAPEVNSYVSSISIAPSASHIVYVGTRDTGLYKSLDNGETWQTINNGFAVAPFIETVVVDWFDSQVVYVGTLNQGIYKTVDGGASWTPIGSGLDTSNINSIVINPNNQQVIYVGGDDTPGTGEPGVYRSLDNQGLSWTEFKDGMGTRPVWSMTIDNQNPPSLYAGTNTGVWKYTIGSSGINDYSISINDGALFTNQTGVTLTLTAPSGTTEMMLSNDGGFSSASWEIFTTHKPWQITSYGDYVIPRTVYAKFRTNGVISGQYQDDIVLDVTAPTGSVTVTDTVMISTPSEDQQSTTSYLSQVRTLTNTVSLPVIMNNARPGFALIGLSLSATDDLSGVGEMLISNQADFAGAVWKEFVDSINWWVPENVTTTVYVKYRDRAGNESEVYTDMVVP